MNITKNDLQQNEELVKAIALGNDVLKDFKNDRHNTLMEIGGRLKKTMNIKEVHFALNVINKFVFPDPLPQDEFNHVVEGIGKYIDNDEAEVRKNILDYLSVTDMAVKEEIELAIFDRRVRGKDKMLLDKTLVNLIQEHKITKSSAWSYKIVKSMQWSTSLSNIGIPIKFDMPYFHDYAYFNYGDIIIIGGSTKSGKTTLAMNFVNRLVKKKVKPVYLYNESGGRFVKTALKLGLKNDDFYHAKATNPAEIILNPNTVYIYDWIRPVDFAKTADLFDSITQKLDETQSIMIGFVQLRDNEEWFATDLLRQFVALSAKYTHCDTDGVDTKFELGDIRDGKSNDKTIAIPCKYIEETREVKTLKEM